MYVVTKAVFDNLDEFKKLHPAFANLDPKNMIKDGLSAPLHEGAARYYREKGWMNAKVTDRDVDAATLVQEADLGGRKPSGRGRAACSRGRASPGRCCSCGTHRRCRSRSTSSFSTRPRCARCISASGSSLAYLAFPFAQASPRDRVPARGLAARAGRAAFCGAYLFLFYREIVDAPGPADARSTSRRR